MEEIENPLTKRGAVCVPEVQKVGSCWLALPNAASGGGCFDYWTQLPTCTTEGTLEWKWKKSLNKGVPLSPPPPHP